MAPKRSGTVWARTGPVSLRQWITTGGGGWPPAWGYENDEPFTVTVAPGVASLVLRLRVARLAQANAMPPTATNNSVPAAPAARFTMTMIPRVHAAKPRWPTPNITRRGSGSAQGHPRLTRPATRLSLTSGRLQGLLAPEPTSG